MGKITCFVLMTMCFWGSVFAGGDCCTGSIAAFDQFLNARDFWPLYDYVNTKRTINLAEKGCNLTISGDIRVDWANIRHRRCDDFFLSEPLAETDPRCRTGDWYDIEFNYRVDYVCDRSWGVAQIWCASPAGIFDGRECNDWLSMRDCYWLRKAYMGYNVCCCNGTRFDIELGRRNLYDVFDSQVQFLSRFDGLLLRFSNRMKCFSWYINGGPFVARQWNFCEKSPCACSDPNEQELKSNIIRRSNHYGFVVEGGLLNICNSGFDVKYSYIDWENLRDHYFWKPSWDKESRSIVDALRNINKFCYQISQFTLYYNFCAEIVDQSVSLFAAFLINTGARRSSRGEESALASLGECDFRSERRNLAWYAGFQIGEVVEEGDWSCQVQYQYVELFAIPNFDVSGLGTGEILGSVVPPARFLNTNYRGVRIEGLYALTDNLSIDARYEYSRQIAAIVGKRNFSSLRVECIFAF